MTTCVCRLCRVFTNIHSLSIEEDGRASQNISIQFPCVCVCLSLQFLVRVFTFLSLNLWKLNIIWCHGMYDMILFTNIFVQISDWGNHTGWQIGSSTWLGHQYRRRFPSLQSRQGRRILPLCRYYTTHSFPLSVWTSARQDCYDRWFGCSSGK